MFHKRKSKSAPQPSQEQAFFNAQDRAAHFHRRNVPLDRTKPITEKGEVEDSEIASE